MHQHENGVGTVSRPGEVSGTQNACLRRSALLLAENPALPGWVKLCRASGAAFPRHGRAALLFVCLLVAATAWASITGSISGIVTDPSGAVVPGAAVTAINTATGVKSTIKTDGAGFYNFPNLPVGTYDVEVVQKGFKTYRQTGIVLNANDVLKADVKLELGEVAEKVLVTSEAIHVETQSTQNGEVITSQKMTSVPLNGRDFTNLLSLQPGVVPFQYANALQDSNLSDRTVSGSGDLNGGNQSINGQRETSNGFMVNGANVEEGKNNGTSVIPNLDSIEEFRIITNNFDAEYGNYSGGQVNVVTKSGTNQFHGSAFEFNRNTAFNTRNFFSPAGEPPKLIQNQFGGTVGGPIRREKIFFFVDYQGTRRVFAPTQSASVPDGTFAVNGDYTLSALETTDLATGAGNAAAMVSPAGAVQGAALATALTNRLGYTVNQNEPYYTAPNPTYPAEPLCTTTAQCVFPNAVIPHRAYSPASAGLLPFIPAPTVAGGGVNFFTSGFDERLRDDKGGVRVDFNTHYGMISAYYHVDDDTHTNPFPNSGATVTAPNIGAFSATDRTRAQLWMVSDTKSFGSTAVNEFRFSYLRDAGHLFNPTGGLTLNGQPITLASLGFTLPASPGGVFNGGVAPIAPNFEGVPAIDFTGELNGTNIGVPADTPNQFNNTFQWCDNFSKVIGRHSLKFGGQFHYDQINDRNLFGENGDYTFDGSESGSDFVDFLIGAPGTFIQATRQILDSRSKYGGAYAQDSWRVTPNLTFNYGLRWEFSQPWYDAQGKIETLIPGRQSVLFPAGACAGCTGAPTGWVVPGDPGVPQTLAPTQYANFSPRLGLAYSPDWDSGFLGKLTGGPGKTSVRVGFGLFYTAFEDLTQFQEIGDAPFGLFWVQSGSFFESPFMDRNTGQAVERFPFAFPPVPVKQPDPNFNWAQVEPISGSLAFAHSNKLPYAEHYELSIQRQFGANTILSVNYVGTQAHRLLTSIEANPASAALCLQLNAAGASPNCGPLGESNVYTLPLGVNYPAAAIPAVELVPPANCGTQNPANACMVNGTYTVLAPQNGNQVFGNNPFEATIAQSSYNSLQVSLRHSGNYSTFLFGYTYSKCMDDASELIEGINPFNPKSSMALCAFDVTHNFVGSYQTKLPFDRAFHVTSGWLNRLASGWSISGITSFATGLPVSLSFPNDNSLTGTQNTSAPIDLPNFTPGPILQNTDPRKGGAYFNTALFSDELPLGTFGTARRRFFHGPGLNNWDMALLKDTRITESKSLEFRFEAFNVWNHTQFSGQLSPGFGAFGSGGFGIISAAYSPRVLQAALKFLF
jgi:Carboxypeptidase regulatory-like domain/TonB dependent receptor